jgi:anaerobic selenocysteine-containing dehydrogenase
MKELKEMLDAGATVKDYIAEMGMRGVQILRTSCEECYMQCGCLVHVVNGRVTKNEGDPEHPMNRGELCPKGINIAEVLYHPNRLLYPMKRTGKKGDDPKWQKIPWDEANGIIADSLEQVIRKYGPTSVCCVIDGYPKYVMTVLFLRSLGSPNVMGNTSICEGPGTVADCVTMGGDHPRFSWGGNIANAKTVLCVGTQADASHPPHGSLILKRKKAGEIKLLVADPLCFPLAQVADIHLQLRPGTDAALFLSMLHVIVNEGLYDKDFVDRWCIGFDKLKERVQQYPPEKGAEICWIPADDIIRAARIYATEKPSCVYARNGINQQVNSVQSNRCLSILAAITGNVDIPGGNLMEKGFPGFIGRDLFRCRREWLLPREIENKAIGVRNYPLWCSYDGFIHMAHEPSVLNAMLYGDPYPVRAMIHNANNIVITNPDSRKWWEAIKGLDFTLSIEHFITPTIELADIVLPAATWVERGWIGSEYYYQAKSVHDFIEPLGETRDEKEMMIDLYQIMKDRGLIKYELIPWKTSKEWYEFRLKGSGYTLEDLKEKQIILTPFKYKVYEENGFRTPSGKLELYSSLLEKHGYDPLPFYREPPQSPYSTPELAKKYPLIISTGLRKIVYFQTGGRNLQWARKRVPDPCVELHPQAAKERGIQDGDWVWIEAPNARRVKMRAKLTDGLHPKVVEAPFAWWYPEEKAPEHGCFKSNINVITSCDGPFDPIAGSPILKAFLCQIYKCEDGEE